MAMGLHCGLGDRYLGGMTINPYQPPTQIESAPTVDDPPELVVSESVQFAGAPTRYDLRSMLDQHDHVGVITIFLTLLLCSLFTLFVVVLGTPAIWMMAGGFIIVIVVACIVSTNRYRQAMFNFANPYWDQHVVGELSDQGVKIHRTHGSEYLDWNCFESIVINRDVVGLITPNSLGQSMVIGELMLNTESEFNALQRITKRAASKIATAGSVNQRQQTVAALARETNRQRSVEVPPGAVAFGGPVTIDDLVEVDRELPRKQSQRKRSLHGLAVRTILAFSGILMLMGLAFSFEGDLGMLGSVVVLVLPITGALWVYGWNRPVIQGGDFLQYLLAFANDDGITSDSFAIVSQWPWSHVRCVANRADRIIFRHTHSRRVITARRDMFANEDDWRKMQSWI